ncbi:hypothetical protein P280DRAFT_484243 [Massarina eburnea CBS 473.64]|uniref:Uncharacterized protein n=1 Tax=Massarina eburnea CBS 473.64 TaxID=1395130 RepID=A0A6A6RNW0_9PLEO|nr:hypothetical protein P280DRAFT_484243 [Massarina eburnea CBS 473.64]
MATSAAQERTGNSAWPGCARMPSLIGLRVYSRHSIWSDLDSLHGNWWKSWPCGTLARPKSRTAARRARHHASRRDYPCARTAPFSRQQREPYMTRPIFQPSHTSRRNSHPAPPTSMNGIYTIHLDDSAMSYLGTTGPISNQTRTTFGTPAIMSCGKYATR